MIRASIIGASGYVGIELVRLLTMHQDVEIVHITSRRLAGKRLTEMYPHMKGTADNLQYEDVSVDTVADGSDVVFTAVPHGTAMEYVPDLIEKDVKVIDLSADYRLSYDVYERVYGKKHEKKLDAVYGLTELHPEVAEAGLVANPGCYPTGAILAAAPLAKMGVISHAVFDSKSGVSGAGSDPSNVSHYPNLAENVIPYNVTSHRHSAEIDQELRLLAGDSVKFGFTPHIVPAIRGILTTAHIMVSRRVTKEEVMGAYHEFYDKMPFIRFLEGGVPTLGSVRGSNFCDVGLEVDSRGERVVVMSAIDNLTKGGSGQGVQNMNLMMGFDETTGLVFPGLAP